MRASVKPGERRVESQAAPVRGHSQPGPQHRVQMHPFLANAGPVFGLTGGQSRPIVQRDLATYEEVSKPEDQSNYSWGKLRPKVKKTERTAQGRGAREEKSGTTWTTEVKWGDLKVDDGTEMTAKRLGPDHGLGSTPGDSGKWVDKRKAQELRAGYNVTYVAGHLLNHQLGGPGNYANNLAAIPKPANDAHANEVEEKIKQIVNVQHGWVYYHVKTDQAQDTELKGNPWYTSALTCHWYQLDERWARNNPEAGKVAGTEAKVTIPIRPPSYYKKEGEGLGGEVRWSENEGSGLKARHNNTAWTKVKRNEVILDTEANLKAKAPVMKELNRILNEIGIGDTGTFDMQQLNNKFQAIAELARTPSEAEAKAYELIEEEKEKIDKLEGEYRPPDGLAQALQTASEERATRHKAIQTAVTSFFSDIFKPEVATEWVNMINDVLTDDAEQRQRIEHYITVVLESYSQFQKTVMSELTNLVTPTLEFLDMVPSDPNLTFLQQVEGVPRIDITKITEVQGRVRQLSPGRKSRAKRKLPDLYSQDNPDPYEAMVKRMKRDPKNAKTILLETHKIVEEFVDMKPFQIDEKLISLLDETAPERAAATIGELLTGEFTQVAQLALEYVKAPKKQAYRAGKNIEKAYKEYPDVLEAFYEALQAKLGS